MRLDRLLTLYFLGPLVRRRPLRELRIPILMYHSISDESEAGHPYYWINTSPALFAKQMQFLHERHYQVISLSEAVDLIKAQSASSTTHLNRGASNSQRDSLGLRYVVLTFDDGYRDFYTEAFPILKKYSYSATVFLPTAFIDGAKQGLRRKQHLTWDQVRELRNGGINFGSHTVNHPDLSQLKQDEIEYELRRSKEDIESYLNEQTIQRIDMVSFCYPYKFPDKDRAFVEMLRSVLQNAGYNHCATTQIGCAETSSHGFFLPRLPMNSGDDIKLFAAKLVGCYNWMGTFQKLIKYSRGRKSS
jgi:peptidoglycan/xylan/chitin deacetylase (PgdA/CDA1 family)